MTTHLLLASLTIAIANEDGSVSHTIAVATDGTVTSDRSFLSSRDIRAAARQAATAQGHRLGLFSEAEPNVFIAESLDMPGATVRAERKTGKVTILPVCTAGEERKAAKAAEQAAKAADRAAKLAEREAAKAEKAKAKPAKAKPAKAPKAKPAKAPKAKPAKAPKAKAVATKTGAEVEAPV